MSGRGEIAVLVARIARAEAARDAWRATGLQERYLEAHSVVEALERQLVRLQRPPPYVIDRPVKP